jgi:hypothetical protein
MYILGKRANEIGPLAVFRERIEEADESLLAAGNYTGCETIETHKKAAADYRKKMKLDENIYMECRIGERIYRKDDVTSEHVEGRPNKYDKQLPLNSFYIFPKDIFTVWQKYHFEYIYFLSHKSKDI